MKGYEHYDAFSEDFENLIDSLRWEEDSLVEAELINGLSAMQTANPEFSDKFLALADTAELHLLMEIGFSCDPMDQFKHFYNPVDNYFEEQGY